MNEINEYSRIAFDLLIEYAPPFLLAILTLVIGLWIIKIITKVIRRVIENRKIDASLQSFLLSLINLTFKALLIISVMGMIGIEMTSFIALSGATGLAIC